MNATSKIMAENQYNGRLVAENTNRSARLTPR
jgi:hypothetical protein